MFYEQDKKGVLLFLKVTPRASSNKIKGIELTADGKHVLKIRVTAVAEDGRANEAVIKLLAKFLHVPKSSCSLIKGESSRLKTILVTEDFERVKLKLLTVCYSEAKLGT